MDEEEEDIKIIIGKAFYTKLEQILLKKKGRFGQRDSRPTVLILLETENLSSAMIFTFTNGCQPLTHGKMTSRAYR